MQIKTKNFGEIDLDEDKILTFENGIMGFEEFKRYTILFNNENEKRPVISWMQSIEEPGLAFPVISPHHIKQDYNPIVVEELLKPLGELNDENLAIFLTLTVPSDLKKITTNLKAPLIINADTKKGCQVIVENQDYSIKFEIYDILQTAKNGKGE